MDAIENASGVNRQVAKPEAKKKAGELYDLCYGDLKSYNPNERRPNPRLEEAMGKI